MSDALKHFLDSEKEEKAEEAYIAELVNYLYHPEEVSKISVIEKMKFYALMNKGNILKDLNDELVKLESNDYESWKIFSEWAEKKLFYRNSELKKKFLDSAMSRNIGSYKWSI